MKGSKTVNHASAVSQQFTIEIIFEIWNLLLLGLLRAAVLVRHRGPPLLLRRPLLVGQLLQAVQRLERRRVQRLQEGADCGVVLLRQPQGDEALHAHESKERDRPEAGGLELRHRLGGHAETLAGVAHVEDPVWRRLDGRRKRPPVQSS